jgi:TolB-like protein
MGEAGMTLNTDMTEREILDHLEDICAAEDFRRSSRCSGFLRYVVGETLAGRTDRIKAYSIAVSALGRDESFDPQVDPVVRIEAGQLRRRLEHYYLTDGVASGIRIDLPKGSYVPTFIRTAPSLPVALPVAANLDRQRSRPGTTIPMVLSASVLAGAGLAVLLMSGLSDRSEPSIHPVPTVQINAFVPADAFSTEMASGLQDEVRRALMDNNHLAVVNLQHALEVTDAGFVADFVIEGSVRYVDGWIRVNARLLDTRTRTCVWASAYDRPLVPEAVLEDQTGIADAIVQQMVPRSNS